MDIYAFSDVIDRDIPTAGVLSFSPDSQLLAVGGNRGGSGWVLPNGMIGTAGHGTYKVFNPTDPLRVFRVSDAARVVSATGFFPGTWAVGLRALAWSPTSSLIAFITAGGDLHVWDTIHTDRPYAVVRLGRSAASLAFSPDGTRLAVCVAGGVELFRITPAGEN